MPLVAALAEQLGQHDFSRELLLIGIAIRSGRCSEISKHLPLQLSFAAVYFTGPFMSHPPVGSGRVLLAQAVTLRAVPRPKILSGQ